MALPVYVYDEAARKAGSLNAAMGIKQAKGLFPGSALVGDDQERPQWDPSLISIGLMSNVRAGHAATPLSGYVLVAPGSAPVPQGLFSASSMFKGRVMAPLLDIENSEVKRVLRENGLDAGRVLDRLKEKVQTVDMPQILTEVLREAYEKVGGSSLVSDTSDALVPLASSDDGAGNLPMFSIVQASNGNTVYLILEAHCALRGGNAPIEQALYDAAVENKTVQDLFWDKTSDFVRLSKRYRDTQIAWRAYVVRRMRAKIVEAMFDAETAAKLRLAPTSFDARNYNMSEVETTYKELHFLTNEDDIVSNGGTSKSDFFVFFSESQRAAEGALVMGGPFRHGLWVGAEASVPTNKFHGSMPFSVPYAYDKSQAEILNEVARVITSGETTTEHVIVPQIRTDAKGAEVYVAYDENLGATLVWPKNKLGSGIQRFLHRQCFETWYDDNGQTADELLGSYGVDMRLAKINRTVRPIITVLPAVDNPIIDLVTTRLYISIVRVESANAAIASADDDVPTLVSDDEVPTLTPATPTTKTEAQPEEEEEEEEEQEEADLEEEMAPKVALASSGHYHKRW